MNKYRIIEDGNGYYQVQERVLWILWVTLNRGFFSKIEEARAYIRVLTAAQNDHISARESQANFHKQKKRVVRVVE